MKSHKIVLFSLLCISPLLLGLSCNQEDPVVVFNEITITPPPIVKSLIPNPVQKEYNQDGTYCTKEASTGYEFMLFKPNSRAQALTAEEWKAQSDQYDIHISSEGILALLTYFKTTICSEALIVCEGFEPTSYVQDVYVEIVKVREDIDKILTLSLADDSDTIVKKLILNKVWVPLKDLSTASLVSGQLKSGGSHDEINL